MENKNFFFLFSSKEGYKIRNLICLCNRWKPERKIKGKGRFQLRYESESIWNNIWSSNCSIWGKGGNTHSETDLGVCSDYGGDPDPHRSTRTRTDQEFNFGYAVRERKAEIIFRMRI